MDSKIANEKLSKQFKNFHSQVHKFRDDTFKYIQRFTNITTIATTRQRKIFDRLCHAITSDVKNILEEYFHSKQFYLEDKISISIKLTLEIEKIIEYCGKNLSNTEKEKLREQTKFVITAYRDPDTYESYRERRETRRKIYSITYNTAFNAIINGMQRCFISNNLKGYPEYKNENSDWEKYYNATIVCPIRYWNEKLRNWDIIGLIAADSLNGQKLEIFNGEECLHILGHAADMLATYFLMLSLKRKYVDE